MKKEEIKEEKVQKKKKHILLKLIVFIIFLIILFLIYSTEIEVKNIIVHEYNIEDELIPSSFDGFKIVQFSDLNYGSTIEMKDVEKLVDLINEQNPDMVLFTGNLIYENYSISKEELDEVISYFTKIDSNVGKYAVKGMNDGKIEDIDIILSNSGFKVLDNSYELIYYKGLKPIFLSGLSSYLTTRIDFDKAFSYYQTEEDTNKKEEIENETEYKIVIFSESDAVDELIKKRNDVNLALASNSLGGLVRIGDKALFKTEGSKKYYNNYYKLENLDLYVSNGIGTNETLLRFNNVPSINLFTLNSTNLIKPLS